MGSPFQHRIPLITLSTVWMVVGTGVAAQEQKLLRVQAVQNGIPASMMHPIDALTYGTSSANIHLLIDQSISNKVYDLTTEYELTDEQQAKLKRAARMEAKQFFFAAEQLHRDYDAAVEVDRRRQAMVEAELLGQQRRTLFRADSFLAKVTDRTVTDEQRLKHETLVNERIRIRHRSNIEGAIRDVEGKVVLQISQHEALVELLLTEIPPPKCLNDFDESLVKYRFSRIPEQTLQPLFRADQWPDVRNVFERFQKQESILKQKGLIAEANDGLSATQENAK